MRVFLGTVGLLFLLYALLLLPPVQHFAVKGITGFLQEKLETEVSLGGVRLQLFDKFSLTDLEIKDHNGEPLLISGRTEVNFQALILNLLRKRLVIQDITLQHARINWVHPYGAMEPNIQFLFDALKKKDQEDDPKNGNSLDLRIKTFLLEDVQLVKLDSVRGNKLTISIREGDGLVNNLDLQTGTIDAKHLFVDGLQIGVDVFDADSATWAILFPGIFESQPTGPLVEVPALAGFPNLCVDMFHVRDGKFLLNNYRKEPVRLTSEEVLDFNYLDVFNIDIVVRSLSFADQQFHGIVDLISFENSTGFKLEKLTVKDATVSDKTVTLYDMRLITPESSLGDTLILTYKSYSDFTFFPDAVKLDMRLRNSSVWINDIVTFASGLERNPFFQKNRNEVVDLDGHITGKINSLRGKDLSVRLAKNTLIQGDFSSLFLAVPDLTSLNLRLKRLETNMKTLRELIPGFNLPPNFDKLGRLVFSGSFDGFFTDFVAYGDLRTELGRATMDMKLSGGQKEPQYSGELALLDFDLKTFTGNPEFGNVTFTSRVIDGKGLTGATANARVEAAIDSMSFRDYMYKNLALEGQLNRNLFDGAFGIQDQNIDFNFIGTIDFTQSVPFFDFSADVRRVDLKRLNLSKKDFILSGQIDLKIQDIDLANAKGQIALKNVLALKDHEKAYTLDSLLITAESNGNQKRLSLDSEMLHGQMEGRYNLKEISAVFFQFLERNYATFFARMGIPKTERIPDTSSFQFALSLEDTKDWMELLIPTLGPIVNGNVQGYFSNENDSLWLEVDLPSVHLGEMVFENVYLNADALRDTCVLDFGIFRTILGSKRELAPVSLLGLINRDTMNFGITAIDYDKLLNKLEMDGVFYLDNQDFFIRFAESKMVILNDEWQIQKNNFIRFGKDYVQTRDFVLTSGDRRIILQSLDRRGLQLYLRQFDLDELNGILEY
ncbi:MAG: hypothetical protein IPL49_13730 [Saprospirales bacterium]|nr:hypothetical protein [Saprospirales bacterium]